MTVYTPIAADVDQPESAQSGRTALSISVNTVIAYTPHNRINSFYEVTATVGSLTLTLPSTLDEGFDLLLKNVGSNAFTLLGTGLSQAIAAGEVWLLYVDSAGNWQATKQLALTPAVIAALAGFGITSDGVHLNINSQALAGNGLKANTTTSPIDVNVDNSTIEITADVLNVKDGGITGAKFAAATIGADKFVGALATLTPLSGTNAALASNGTIVVATPGGTQANQFYRMTEVLELIGGSEWRVMREQDYRVDLSREDQVTVTKLTAGPSNVRVQVCGVT
jgi:hypothetical protein